MTYVTIQKTKEEASSPKLGANSLFDELAVFLKGAAVLSAVLSAAVCNGEVLLVWLFS